MRGGGGLVVTLPLRLRPFDQAKVMFVRLAAITKCACLAGEQIVAPLFKTNRGEKINEPIQGARIGGKSSNNVGEYSGGGLDIWEDSAWWVRGE